jgi:hypothetical protein
MRERRGRYGIAAARIAVIQQAGRQGGQRKRRQCSGQAKVRAGEVRGIRLAFGSALTL